MDQKAFKRPKKSARIKPACPVCSVRCISTTMLAHHMKADHTPEQISEVQKSLPSAPVYPIRNDSDAAVIAIERVLAKRNKS